MIKEHIHNVLHPVKSYQDLLNDRVYGQFLSTFCVCLESTPILQYSAVFYTCTLGQVYKVFIFLLMFLFTLVYQLQREMF